MAEIGPQTADDLGIAGELVVEQPLPDPQAYLLGGTKLRRALDVAEIVRRGPVDGHVAVTGPDAVGLVLPLLPHDAKVLRDLRIRRYL